MEYAESYMDCYVNLKDGILTIGNNRIERIWDLCSSMPFGLSLKNKRTAKEWLVDKDDTIWNIQEKGDNFRNMEVLPDNKGKYDITVSIEDDLGFSEKFMKVEVLFSYSDMKLTWVHVIYPGLPILRSHLECLPLIIHNNVDTSSRNETMESINWGLYSKAAAEDDYIDYLPLNSIHCKWILVSFKDVTDHHNNLVKVEEGLLYKNETNKLQGNLLFLQELLSDEGILFIKEGPTSYAYQGGMNKDFCIHGNEVFTCGWGFTASDLHQHSVLSTYGSAVVLFSREEEALLNLHKYHRAVHKFDSCRDAFIMSNTWGDRSKDGKLGEQFILEELECAKQLRINFCQIDDGWQKGVTVNSVSKGGVWEGYHKNDPEFWTVNQNRFPRGLEPIVASANEKSISLGLWFSPDSTCDFENWRKDAENLLMLHRKYGISAFKLDGVKIRSKKGEENLFSMMHKVIAESGNRVFFNQDTTAEVRNGYFGRVQYGCIFLENRYTDWGIYYPHWTLRNLWLLSKYYPTFRFQMEFLNVKRNADKYKNDVLAPFNCGIEYSFAVTMFSNPLAWMELSGLDKESCGILGKVIPVYRKHQADILSGYILPIGDEPSGTSWTGFQSIKEKDWGYLLIIKENNCKSFHSFKLWHMRDKKVKLEAILGQGCDKVIGVNDLGEVYFELDGKYQYSLYKYNITK